MPSKTPTTILFRRAMATPKGEPVPLTAEIGRLDHVTAIQRSWRPEDAARCTKCPREHCNYRDDTRTCMVLTTLSVAGEEAKLFRLPAAARAGRRTARG